MLLGTFKDSGREGVLYPLGAAGGEVFKQTRGASGSGVCRSRWSLGPLRGRGYSLLRITLLLVEPGTPETLGPGERVNPLGRFRMGLKPLEGLDPDPS